MNKPTEKANWVFVGIVVLAFAAQLLVQLFMPAHDAVQYYAVHVLAVELVAIGIPMTLFMRKNGGPEQFFVRKTGAFEWVWGVLLGVGLFFLITGLEALLSFLWSSLGIEVPGMDITVNGVWRVIAMIVLLAVIPALMEETLFRGMLLSTRLSQGRTRALWTVSVLFALMHGDPFSLPVTFVAGIILTGAAISTGSVYPAVAAHLVHNVLSILIGNVSDPEIASILPSFSEIGTTAFIYVGIGLVFCVMARFGLARAAARRGYVQPERKKAPFDFTGFLPAFLAWAILLAVNLYLVTAFLP